MADMMQLQGQQALQRVTSKPLANEASGVALKIHGDFSWHRGPIRQEGDTVTIRLTERYQPGQHIWQELARVKTPDEAVAFLKAWGPLQLFYADGEEPHVGFEDVAKDTRQSLSRVLKVAKTLRGHVQLLARVREAHAGDREALAVLRRLPSRARRLRKPEFLARLEHSIAGVLSDQLVGSDVTLTSSGRGYLAFSIRPQHLEQYCFLDFARDAAGQTVLRVCPGCDGVFHTEDVRQQFCGPRCATRVRVRRFREQH
jgi:hypothetical protein